MPTDYNPLNEIDLRALKEAVDENGKHFRGFRDQRMAVLRQLVGFNYSENGASTRVYTNLLELAINLYLRQLISANPQVLITTEHDELRRTARLMELSVNKAARDMNLRDSLRMWHMEALICLGVMKVGLADAGAVEINGVTHTVGKPYADPVDFDNYVHDMTARDIHECDFIADKYRVPLDEAREANIYDKSVREQLKESDEGTVDGSGSDRAESLSRGTSYTSGESFRKYIDLWDIYLPYINTLVTIPNNGKLKALRIVEREGPDIGPYIYLPFTTVPANSMPLPPVAAWYDLHMLGNLLFRKLAAQADRQKIVFGARAGQEADASTLTNAADGEVVGLDDPSSLQPIRYPGADNGNLGFFLQVQKLFSYFAGNLDVMGGLSPQAETLGQERLLATSSSHRLQAMREISVAQTEQVMKAIAWYKWSDPLDEALLSQEIPGTGIKMRMKLKPDDKLGDFMDYNLSIQPYSLQQRRPEERLQLLEYVFGRFIMPNLQGIMAQGGRVDYERLLDLVGQYTHMDEMRSLVKFLGMEENMGIIGNMPGLGGSPTERRYKRISVSGTTKAGEDGELMQQLLQTARGREGQESKLVGW